jgi:hypothetical protein
LTWNSEKFYINRLSGAERDARFSIKELFYEINKDLVDLELKPSNQVVETFHPEPISTRPAGFETDMFTKTKTPTWRQDLNNTKTSNATKEVRFWKRGSFSWCQSTTSETGPSRIDNNVWAGYVYDELF